MKILIDLQSCQSVSRFRGIGRYSLSLARAMIRNSGEHEISILLNNLFTDTIMPLRNEFRGLIPQQRIHVFSIHGHVAESNHDNSWYARVAELIREYAVAEISPDILHISSLFEGFVDDAVTSIGALDYKIPVAVTLYDLIPLLNPETYLDNPLYKTYYYRKIESLKKADILLAISESARNEVKLHLKDYSGNIVNISSAADSCFKKIELSSDSKKSLLHKYRLKKKFLMYMGVVEPRKNFENLIKAYSLLSLESRSHYQLFLIAQGNEKKRKNLRDFAYSLGISPREIVITEYVPDEDLPPLLSLCHLFVFPSLHEGFGLPVLEAMSCGAAVIGSNTTSIPEVIGRKDALFDPNSAEDIARLITKALNDKIFYSSLCEHSLLQPKNYSWDDTAKKTISSFEEICKKAIVTANKDAYNLVIKKLAELLPDKKDREFTSAAIAISLSSHSAKKQLFVDVSEIIRTDAKTGIQRVVRSILSELLKNPPEGFDVVPVYGDVKKVQLLCAHEYVKDHFGYSSIYQKDLPVEFRKGDIFLGLDLSAHLFPSFEIILDKFKKMGIFICYVVYDIIPILHPEWCHRNMPAFFEQWMNYISRYSDALLCISRAVANDVEKWLYDNKSALSSLPDVYHFHLGADISGSIPTTGLPDDSGWFLDKIKTAPTFLMVGTVEPRKGHKQALKAFSMLWKNNININLVIIGKTGWNMNSFSYTLHYHPEYRKHLFWFERISDEYLDMLYASSSALLAPSEAEGFGLPLIEAAKHKIPIIARNIPVFNEVAGKHAYYFENSTNPKMLANAIMEWLKLYAEGTHVRSDDMKYLTWEESANQLLDVIMESATAV